MDPFELAEWSEDVTGVIDEVAIHSSAVRGPRSLFVALKGTHTDGHKFVRDAYQRGARYALVDENYQTDLADLNLVRTKQTLTGLQSLAKAYRKRLKIPIIAITGPSGKTQVKDLLALLLRQRFQVACSPESFNSQLGVALSLLAIRQSDEIALIEAGFSEPGELERLLELIEPDHQLVTSQLGGQVERLERPGTPGASYQAGTLTFTLPLALPYQLETLDVAIAMARKLGLTDEELARGLSQYHPEPTCSESWTSPLGTHCINDSYCAAPLSIRRSLQLLRDAPTKRKVFLFSGIRAADPAQVGAAFTNAQIDKLILIGEARGYQAEIASSAPQLDIAEAQHRREALSMVHPWQGPDLTLLMKGAHHQPLDALAEDFAEGLGPNRLLVDLEQIRDNVAALPGPIMAMVKADGYGVGAATLTRHLQTCGVSRFGLAHVSEAIALRLQGIDASLFVLHAAAYEVPQVVQWNLEPGISDPLFLELLQAEAVKQDQIIKVHLHVDTGMTRLGCQPDQAPALAAQIASSSHLTLEGLFTHLACADDPTHDSFTKKQLDTLAALPITAPQIHACNTAGLKRFNPPFCTLSRIGLGLLDSALTLTSRIAAIQTLQIGQPVSYGSHYRATRPQERIGIIPLGYYDNIAATHILLHDLPAPVVGTICMDYLMVDLTDHPHAQVHDPITIPLPHTHHAISRLSPRIQRIFLTH